MLFPALSELLPPALLALRIVLALLYGKSGWSHVAHPRERGASIGMHPTATFGLGVAELAGAFAILTGWLAQLGALLLIAVMAGALWKKASVWKTGFWGGESQGWFYELLYITALLVIVATGGGAWTLGWPAAAAVTGS